MVFNFDDGVLAACIEINESTVRLNVGERPFSKIEGIDETVALEDCRLSVLGRDGDVRLVITAKWSDQKAQKEFKADDYELVKDLVRQVNFELNCARRAAGMEV